VDQRLITSTSNPNVFGEFIRDFAFVKHKEYDFGCYSTFDLQPDFEPIEKESKQGKKILRLLGWDDLDSYGEDIAEEIWKGSSLYTDGIFVVAWYWDGDGTLLVGCDDEFAINDDCKKDYNWEWI